MGPYRVIFSDVASGTLPNSIPRSPSGIGICGENMRPRWSIASTFRPLLTDGDIMPIEACPMTSSPLLPTKMYIPQPLRRKWRSRYLRRLLKGAVSLNMWTDSGSFCSYLICNLLSKKKQRHSGSFSFSSFNEEFDAHIWGRFPDAEKIPTPLLQLSEVTFGYTPDKLILDRVNFDVSLDSRLAIVGANGAGKSTLWAQGHLAIFNDFISMIESSY